MTATQNRPALSPALPAPDLPEAEQAALAELWRRGTPANTLRAWERDLIYLTAWKQAAFGAPLAWPETEAVALRFLLDHARDLNDAPAEAPTDLPADGARSSARAVALALIALGLRRSLACPAPATLDRRIASWRAFHRMKNLASPFEAPLIAQARGRARRAAARPLAPKSQHPITRPVLEAMLAGCDHSHRGLRDRAALMLGWASGGRRRSEIVALDLEDLDLRDWPGEGDGGGEGGGGGLIRFRLHRTKTTGPGQAPRLLLQGRPARALADWLAALHRSNGGTGGIGTETAAIGTGPLFRPVSQSDRILSRRLSADGLARILRHRLSQAGYPPGFASPHGLRAGFLTQAALDGAPLQAAMRLSLHRSAQQAQRYYADVELAENPAANLLG